ncbi:hypothetical protein [Streptomyces sp. NPDC050504]|uniref:hypothetical protein n=1 Tax=Streptomyces sp. NPDC050504 TaxID=3365618 RepID=UPI0037A5FB58
MPELTPHELRLLARSREVRGYTPRDGATEPDEGPAGPAGASPQAALQEPGGPGPAAPSRTAAPDRTAPANPAPSAPPEE